MHVEVKGDEQDVFVVNPGFLKLRHLQVDPAVDGTVDVSLTFTGTTPA